MTAMIIIQIYLVFTMYNTFSTCPKLCSLLLNCQLNLFLFWCSICILKDEYKRHSRAICFGAIVLATWWVLWRVFPLGLFCIFPFLAMAHVAAVVPTPGAGTAARTLELKLTKQKQIWHSHHTGKELGGGREAWKQNGTWDMCPFLSESLKHWKSLELYFISNVSSYFAMAPTCKNAQTRSILSDLQWPQKA